MDLHELETTFFEGTYCGQHVHFAHIIGVASYTL